jgi:hypothetical protein
MTPDRCVWIFNADHAMFPGGAFTERSTAEGWIALHGLSGALSAYPLDEGCYDFAVRNNLISARALAEQKGNPKFVGGFSSASLDHFHYEQGRRVTG